MRPSPLHLVTNISDEYDAESNSACSSSLSSPTDTELCPQINDRLAHLSHPNGFSKSSIQPSGKVKPRRTSRFDDRTGALKVKVTSSTKRNPPLKRRMSPTETSLRQLWEQQLQQDSLRAKRSEEQLQRVYETQLHAYLEGRL